MTGDDFTLIDDDMTTLCGIKKRKGIQIWVIFEHKTALNLCVCAYSCVKLLLLEIKL